MGRLLKFDLGSYGCDTYVETGTGKCVTLSKAAAVFDRCYSVDLDPSMIQQAQAKFPAAVLYQGLSTQALAQWLQQDLKDSNRVLFFLDAHFPGADFGGARHDVTVPNAVPLQEELQLIKQYRPTANDVIICDDARIYTTGLFQSGNTPWLQVPGGYQFVYDLFPEDKISLSYQEEGYIIIDRR